ncbi:type I polyketide synthase [Frankia sp. QA3]|uniref:type I polyketide synthase n=1 Tax=Frankia sp. QA3 TaxID=710111 RepID=UPI000269C1D6|nr:type I polyketide synthase [Frankia sp. QA3]EIV91654.1 polyketide synthase family protein [Frankia sp. QA3]
MTKPALPPSPSEPDGFDDRRLARTPIAIVGMSGLFPMARNHREYWQNVVDGVDCTTEVPPSRWDLDDYYDSDPTSPDKTYSRRGAFIPDVEFSPLEFGLPPNQLEVTSTMQTLSLGVARDVLRDAGARDAAGAAADWYDSARTGVVLGTTGPVPLMHPLAARLSTPVLREAVRSCGLSEADADAISRKYVEAFAPWEENSFPGLLANVVAGRVANRLGLGGMNTTVDAACAASLSAVRLAVAELVDGRADTMITGGVDTENTIFIYLCFSKVQALSKSGTISPFSDDADGTLLGEGIGMLALRRLADARRDGNRIYAVIRGIGSSSDGRSKSIYAPRAEGQRVALERAYHDADCSPASVELFEAHATGTAVGDRTELTALGGLLRDAGDERNYAALGSVKSQIGHTKGAAGTASLMKLALGLYHKVLPPTINVERPNSAVDFTDAPFYVNVANRPWIRDPHRPVRRAAASAMGFGGTNFHVVLEEDSGDRSAVRALHRTARAHLWHAPDAPALLELLRAGAPSVDGPIPVDAARVGFVAPDDDAVDELREIAISQLERSPDAAEWSHPRGIHFRRAARENITVAGLFAGQGSQYLDMGLDAALGVPPVGAAFDEANAAFDGAERRLAPIVFPPPVFEAALRQEQEVALRATEHAQPAIGALSVGQFRYLRELGLRCAGYLGHSFGELTALHAAGALDAAGFFRLARERGLAMAPPAGDAGADRGTMAAVPADRDRVAAMLTEHPDLVICNHNAPEQVVVGGPADAVAAFVRRCAEQGLDARPLPVSAAFHTRYVAHAVDRFTAALASVPVTEPAVPVYPNTRGASYGPDSAANAAVLARQLLEPVEFVDAVRAAHAAGCDIFVEFGPKQVLTRLVRQILPDADVVTVPTDAGPLGNSDVALKQAAVQLAVLGVDLSGLNRYQADPFEAIPAKGPTVTLSAPEYTPPARRAAYAAALDDGYRITAAGAPAAPALPAPRAELTSEVTTVEYVPTGATGAEVNGVGVAGAGVNGAGANGAGAHHSLTGAALLEHAPVNGAGVNGAGVNGAGTNRAGRNGAGHLPEAVAAHHPGPLSAGGAAGLPAGADILAQQVNLHAVYLESQLDVANRLVGALQEYQRRGQTDERFTDAVATVAGQSIAIGQTHTRANEVLAQLAALELATADPGAPTLAGGPRPTLPGSFGSAPAAPRELPPTPTPTPTPAPTTLPAQLPIPAQPTTPDAPAPGAGVGAGVLDREAVRGALVEVVAEKTGYAADMIDTGMDLEADLGVDSIKRVQVLGALRERFPQSPTVGPEQLAELRTLDQIADFVAAAPPGSSGSPAGFGGPEAGGVDPKAGEPAGAPRRTVRLVTLPGVDRLDRPYAESPVAVVVHRGDPGAGPILDGLRTRGWTVREADLAAATPGGPAVPTSDDVERALAAAFEGRTDLALTVLTPRADRDRADRDRADRDRADRDRADRDHGGWDHSVAVLAETVLVARHAHLSLSATAAGGSRAAFVTITRLDGGLGHHGTAGAAASLLGGVGGVVKTLAAETPELFCRAVDLAPGLAGETVAELLDAELHDVARDTPEVGIDAASVRRTVVPGLFDPLAAADPADPAGTTPGDAASDGAAAAVTIGADDVLVVSGGARGVTALCVRALAERAAARFVLLGRSALADEPDWAAGVADDDLKTVVIDRLRAEGTRPTPREVERIYQGLLAQREIRATVAAIAAAGGRAEYVAVDVTDAGALRAALGGVRGQVTGVVHGAGVLADALLPAKTAADVARVFAPKLTGLRALLDALDGAPLRHLILFTSVAGLYGNLGQADYAAANEALCRVAAAMKHDRPDWHVTAIDWGAWDGGMVTPALRELFQARGVELLPPDAGARAFAEAFRPDRADEVCVLVGPGRSLAEPTAAGGPAVRARRPLSPIVDHPVIAAHRIGAHRVLPATFGLGWMINVVERSHPGRRVVEVRDFAVHKGIVFDGASPDGARVEAEPAVPGEAGRLLVRVAVRADGSGRLPVSHYAATFLLAATEPDPARPGPALPGWPGYRLGEGPPDALDLYTEGTQFHAPRLQGMRRVLARTGDRLVLECQLDDDQDLRAAFGGALHSPVLADVLLQGPPVLGKALLGQACLPLGIGRAEYFHPLPDAAPFVLVLDRARVDDGGGTATVSATACTPDGAVLVRFTDVMVAATAGMAAKFAEAVQAWRQPLTENSTSTENEDVQS